jgi:hypothetical protein
MNFARTALILIAWILTLGQIEALSLASITDSMRIEKAKRIVIGKLRAEGEYAVIDVEEVLKGNAEPKIVRRKWRSNVRVPDKVLLVEGPDYEARNNPISVLTPIEKGSSRWTLYHSLINPVPLIETAEFSTDLDALRLLGFYFDPVRITAPDAPEVARRLSGSFVQGLFPWNYQGELDLRCRSNPERKSRLEILSMTPADARAQGFRRVIILDGMEERMRASLPAEFTIHIDTRLPPPRGSLDYRKAAEFLRGRLELSDEVSTKHTNRPDPSLVPALKVTALQSLARMRDLDSVPAVIDLMGHENESIARMALKFLELSRDSRATEPLCKLLAAHAPSYPENYWLSNGSSQALGKIQDPKAIPYLEDAVGHRVETAYQALSDCGRAESIGVILDSANKDGLPNQAGVALSWLMKRSNHELEPWMDMKEMRGLPMSHKLTLKWRDWWSENRNNLSLVRTKDEAILAWNPPEHPIPNRKWDYLRRNWWMFLLCAGLLLGAFPIGKWLIRQRVPKRHR